MESQKVEQIKTKKYKSNPSQKLCLWQGFPLCKILPKYQVFSFKFTKTKCFCGYFRCENLRY